MSKDIDVCNVDPFSETPLDMDVSLEYKPDEYGLDDHTKEKFAESLHAEPLAPEQIRWFYKDDVNKRWVEFCGHDSLRIENAWRQKQQKVTYVDEHTHSELSDKPESNIIVRGGMYDVNIEKLKCQSIYCPGEECNIVRGTWFYDGSWMPLELEYSQVLEEAHLKIFCKHSLTQSKSSPELGTPTRSHRVLHTEHFIPYRVEWHAINEVILYSEYTPSKLMRSVTSKLGFSKTTGYRLVRGWKVSAENDDKPPEIEHLVFVIHGIGQKRDTGKIIRNTTLFRECIDRMKQKYFPKSINRVEFFPVEWRSSLKLDGDIVEAITPYSVLSLRHLLNTSAMDILYYTSPLYGGEVRAGLQKELNRLYKLFISRHSGWNGKISILAHSLGCVIVYDIVTGWTGFETRALSPESPESSSEGLLFQIENLFCLGSPLSVFLALRTKAPSNKCSIMPEHLCKRFYNIFHWSDPVAYRMEPLLEREYSKIEPVLIPPHGGSDSQVDQFSYHSPGNDDRISPSSEEVENEEKDESSPTRNVDKGWSLWNIVRAGWATKEGSSPTPENNPILLPHQELTQRLDYVLQAVGIGRNYLYSVTAHTAYWNNCDVAYFILTKLFPTLET